MAVAAAIECPSYPTSLACAGRSSHLNGKIVKIAQDERHGPISSATETPSFHTTTDDHFTELMGKVMREAGLDWDRTNDDQARLESYSVPSSPRKALKRLALTRETENGEGAYINSNATLASEDESPFLENKEINSVVVGPQNSSPAAELPDYHQSKVQEQTGSQFYHMSFTPQQQENQPPPMYIPASTSPSLQHQIWSEKKTKRRFGKLRDSVKSSRASKNKLTIRRISSPTLKPSGQRWIDSEDDLDPVSKPSYFRHIGRIVGMGPGTAYTVELHKPPQGRLGLYIVQGFDEDRHNKSVFISRFYQQNAEKFYAGLVHPGDELLAVDDRPVRDKPVAEVQQMIARLEIVRLTILPELNH